jgi:hypothetical protein
MEEIAMHKTDDPNMPPRAALAALRQPRRTQLNDPRVKALLAEWKRRERPIEYGDLWAVAALIGYERTRDNVVILGKPDARTRRKIVAAVEAAGIKIRNYDAWRRMIHETGRRVQLNARGILARIEEEMWRWPEKWDNRPPRPPKTPWMIETELEWEYGPTLERFKHKERFRQEKFPWLDGRVLVKRPRHVDALRPEEVRPGDVVHKPLQLPESQEEKGSGIRVLVRRRLEECVHSAEELRPGDVIMAWPAPEPAEEASEERERRVLEIEKAIRDQVKELTAEDKRT